MKLSLADLITPLTREQCKLFIEAILVKLGVKNIYKGRFGVVNTIITIVSALSAALSGMTSLLAASMYLDYASKKWLTMLAWFNYGVDRIAASRASVTIRIISSTFYGSFDVGELRIINPTTGAVFVNTSAISITPGSTSYFEFSCTEEGPIGNSPVGSVTKVDGEFAFTAYNTTAGSGSNEETDSKLRARCRAKLGSLSPFGAADAYRYIALSSAINGVTCGVTRVKVIGSPSTATVTVIVAGESGAITGTLLDASTNLGRVYLDLQLLAKPLGITLVLDNASSFHTNVSCSVWVSDSTKTDLEITSDITLSLAELAKEIPIGGYSGNVYLSQLASTITASSGAHRVTVSFPVADITMDPDAIIIFDSVTVGVTR